MTSHVGAGATGLLTLDVRGEADVYASRHAGREVAIALGVDPETAVRLATSLSEVARDVIASGSATVSFELADPALLRVVVTVEAGEPSLEQGLEAARRLKTDVAETTGPGGRPVVTLSTVLDPPMVLDDGRRRALMDRLPTRVARSAIDELHAQNHELVAALAEVQAQRDALTTVNAELEETNRGVMALYDELSGELDTTNQGVVALYAEIDDKSRQLREASESKTSFLNNISHELRTPGNSVLGLARLLLDPGAEPLTDEQRQQVELINGSAVDLLRLVNELLDLAKAESGRIEPVFEAVDLAAIFDELRGTIRPLVTRPGVTLDVRPPIGAEDLRTDPTLLRHVLRNLLSNAVKFTEHGTVAMSGSVVAGVLRVTVSDTGIGIAEADQPRVFEEFFQVRGTLQSQAKGSGLGLPFARRLAALLGGDLALVSTHGEGTTFTLELPLAGPPAAARQEEADQ
jgi:signal transduction histidine kinase